MMDKNLNACHAAVEKIEKDKGNPQYVFALLLLEIAVQLSELRQTLENRPA